MTQQEWIILGLCLMAAVLHGMSGIGFPMMSTAALSSHYDLAHAVALVTLPCLILNMVMLGADPTRSWQQSLRYYTQKFWPLVLSSLIGSILGVKLLLFVDQAYLKLLMGVSMLIYVLDQFRRQPFSLASNTQNMLIFGALAGLIGGATNAMAPFLMMYLLSARLAKVEIVVVSNLCFVASKWVQLAMLTPVILSFQRPEFNLLILITLFALFGIWLGSRLRHVLAAQHFKVVVLMVLMAFALHALWQGVALLQHS